MIIAVTLHNATTRRQRDSATFLGLLLCISGVFWCGLAALKYEAGEIPFMDGVHVRVALEHANYRSLQESYPQGDGRHARRTHRRLSDEQQYAPPGGGRQRGTAGQVASLQELTPSWQTSHHQVSMPEDIELLSPSQGDNELLPSQQQHTVESASRPLPQLFSPERGSQELESPSQFRSAGSHHLRESFQNSLMHSETVDQMVQTSSGLPHEKVAPQLPRLERRTKADQGDVERPIMYTYYEKALTDMTDEADASLLENWKKAWFDAGWEPFVLNESDARGLPEFDALVELVVDPKHVGTYNMACE